MSWQFWIDVGGTFTDCLAKSPVGDLIRRKVLSSGVVKGTIVSGGVLMLDTSLAIQPEGFWRDYNFRVLDSEGKIVDESPVKASWNSELQLRNNLKDLYETGAGFELVGGEEAPILAIRWVLGLRLDEPIPPVSVRLGTTRGTNALITRRGARTAFVTTKGFGDILKIGYQNRPRLFDLAIKKPEPLFSEVLEIDERITPDGEVIRPLDEPALWKSLAGLHERGIESLAICLLNSYAQSKHEDSVAAIAHHVGFDEISISSEVATLIKIVSRGDTTVADAYLNPILRQYVARLRESLGESDLRLLTSAGGLVQADKFVGKDSILSGPAGGVVGFSRVAQNAGFDRAIGFDMGGTSTDVSRFDGRYELEYETEKAGVRVVAPMMSIETVAAGGGSICHFDGVKLAVGPDSAGADPGPACYGCGGPLTVTDINFFQGKILAEHFPFTLDLAIVERRIDELCEEIDQATGRRYTPTKLADGFLRIANANMAKAIRSISIAKGYDPRDYVLVSFGGAGAQHACAIAEELGIERILNHPDAGILSAYGIGMADVVRHRAEGVYRDFSQDQLQILESAFERLACDCRKEVLAEGIAEDHIEVIRSLDLRYRGLDAFLTIARPSDGDYATAYETEHRRLYGYVQENQPIEIVAVRIEVVGRSQHSEQESVSAAKPAVAEPVSGVEATFGGKQHATNVFQRESLVPGNIIEGPAIIVERNSTTVVDPGWTAEMLSGGELVLSWGKLPACHTSNPWQAGNLPHEEADPVLLEIFNNQFAGIAEQMGITLRNTSSSVNVKERLDFSCALFTPTGDLVVNAPHIPVHLGAMSATVKHLIKSQPDMKSGDVFVTNDPYHGGSHLPDVTVVTPVHSSDEQLLFFTASRAHHAEIGGIVPGSMPPFSKNLGEEGVLIRDFKLVDAGTSRIDDLRELLTNAHHPTRNVSDNIADITAQIAANEQGSRDLFALIDRYTLPVVQAYMQHIQSAAEQKMRAALAQLADGCHKFVDHLDEGSPIAVAITVDGDRATVDFTGTGPVLDGNLNANRAIVTSAVMYCLRLLIEEDIPLNEGMLAPIEIVLPECLLNPPIVDPPEQCAAIVGGNVETSQRVVDVVLGALGLAAASQGTMNNLTFGDETFGYYETICGGSGATATSNGADAVQTHMTNTRLTDPEVVEQRYPVRIEEFSIRQDSGGAGQHRGGNGVVRRLKFLSDLKVSILSQRRGEFAPYGSAGGQPGLIGENTIKRADGTEDRLESRTQIEVGAGDELTIQTPGGGGFGNMDG